ncbi:dynein light chain 1, cytoplasmic [Halteromyces radiatus]|uniref:dynein light chain 1, cytoplasmic n=1 Tax=Halteromyces radiatus TaxID=101107 RepID=UPI00222043B6|nr:dynein light chain 1, cytoplasmic [Halteromyces radiatus]KAI8098618.1 dynein light chain 1, cytoplasmic [Halteromyces radiatus]
MIELIIAAIQAILQVIVIAGFGVLLTKAGYFDQSKQKWLSKVNMTFFTPCLLFTNIASTISLEKLITLWPIPMFFILFLLISWTTSQVILRIMGVQHNYQRFVIACSMFCNTNSLPVAIISSLAFSEAGHLLYWNSGDTPQDVAARGVAYCLFFAMFCNVIRWSYGYHLLQPDDDLEEHTTMKPFFENTIDVSYTNKQPPSSYSIQCPPENDTPNESSPLLPIQFNDQQPFYRRLTLVVKQCHRFMSPPLYAAFLALMVGLSPLQPYLFDKDAFLYPSVTKAIQSCGKAAVPLILVCLGSQLTLIAQEGSIFLFTQGSRAILASLVNRMIMAPMVVIGIVFVLLRYTQIKLMQDPMFVVTILILGCTPTAINLSQITQVSGVFEQEMMQVLFWSYGVMCVPIMTLVVLIALTMVDLWM